jgi:hypothetical protein
MYIFKMFWATMRCTKRNKNLSVMVREDLKDMGGHVTEE